MRKKGKRLLSSMLTVALTLSMATTGIVSADTKAEIKLSNEGYEIYPKPQNMNYTGGDFVIRKDVNVVYDSTVDNVTKNRMTEVLKSKNKTITESDEVVTGKTNIVVGTYSSKEYAGNYIQDKDNIDASLFNEIDSYYMTADNGEIRILGKDTDAAFYGITSLMHIFNQMDGSTIKQFEMRDYADTEIRGFIEGYYGIPWSNKDRMSLMEFGGDFKMTAYMFAPKDDLYHTTNWRELYPEDELAKISEMVKVGNETKTKFVWTVHPFMRNGFDDNNYEAEMEKMIAKFEQLYSIGVRQFGVLGDDVGNLDREIITNMMNDLVKWGESKGDIEDWVFCPVGYNTSWQGDFSELNDLDAAFPDNVQIFWTGTSVCRPVDKQAVHDFKYKNALEGVTRRSPLFWLNWPVNDINMSRLMLGKGSLLHTDVNPDDLAGVVTNPMQDAEASKIALFAIADYAWNVKEFNDDKSWEDSFKYIDSDASKALHTIAKHTSDPTPNTHTLVLEESEEIKPLLEEFTTKLNNKESIIEIGNKLIAEMNIIIKACDEFVTTSKNAKLVEEIEPFAKSLKDLSNAIKLFVQTAIDLEGDFTDSAVQNFAKGTTMYESSKNHYRKTIRGQQSAIPGSKRLVPFAELVKDTFADEINELVGGGESLKLTASSNIDAIYQGKIDNIVDGNNDTFIWNSKYEAVGQYYQVDFSKPTTIYGVDILNGNPSKPQDTFGKAKVQYTTDGQNWKDMNNETYGPYATEVKITGVELNKVIGVRYICTETDSGRKWPAMREFRILTSPQVEVPEFTSEVIRTMDGWKVYSGNEANMLDSNPNTSVHYNVRQGLNPGDTTIPGDYVGVKLSQPITLGKINILQAPNEGHGDYFKDTTLEYSLDGENYIELKKFTNQRDIIFDASDLNIKAQYVRLKNNVQQHTWIGFREFDVDAKVVNNGKIYTNVDEYKNHPANYFNDNASMVEFNDVTLESGKYIGLKLDRIHELTDIVVNGTNLEDVILQVSKNGKEWTEIGDKSLTQNIAARYIRLVNTSDTAVNIDVTEFKIASKEIYETKVIKNTMGSPYGDSKIENLFDKDRVTKMVFNKSQTAGNHLILDLGQEIDLEELKLVIHDSDNDYIRDGKVYASTDLENWGDAIITIGDQKPNTTPNDDTIYDSFPEHEISYNVALASNINKKARYIKLEITQSHSNWTRLNEIEINNGEYIPSVNNPTFESNVADTQNGLFEYLVDGDITTMYVPAQDTGYLTYSISDLVGHNKIKVMQNDNKISNAQVSARVISKAKTEEWIELGTLNKGTNEFIIPDGKTLLEVKFDWNGVVPNLVELMFNTSIDTNTNKERLQQLVTQGEDTTNWTQETANNYNEAIKVGKEILNNEYASQTTIDSAVKEIEKAIENKKLKGNTNDLQSEIEKAILDSENYTVKTWLSYEKVLNAAKEAMKNTDNLSQEDIDLLLSNLQKAKKALVYNPTNREEAQVILEDTIAYIETVEAPENEFTTNSWESLLKAKTELEQLIELNTTTPQHPTVFEKSKNTLIGATDSLVSITSLLSKIEEFEAITDPSIYTQKSYEAYETEINIAKELLVNGTDESIENAIVKIDEAKNNLKLIVSSENLKKLIEEIKNLDSSKYTTNSYKELMDRVFEIEALNLDLIGKEELKEYEKELRTLKNALVNVEALSNIVERAKKFNPKEYTLDSYNTLIEAIKSSDELFVSGNKKEINNSIKQIKESIKELVQRVDAKEITDYINSIKDIDLDKYTEKSAKVYNDALVELKAMLENIENTSALEFVKAKSNFEKAQDGLKLKIDKPDKDKDKDKVNK